MTKVKLDHAHVSGLLRGMIRIRRFEEKAGQLYGMGEIGGFCHLYIGQEAVVVGMEAVKKEGDQVITGYRDHGHMLACGMDPNGVMAELTGRSGGLSRGKGGSMHMFSTEKKFYGGHGIVGAQIPLGAGLAMANKYRGNDNVSFTYFGDGASNQGQVFEAMNMAAVIKVPAIFVFENNHYSEHTGDKYAVGTSLDIASRAEAFGMKVWRANGCDFYSTFEAMADLLDHVRGTGLPAAIELDTERFYGHFEGDPQRYRAKGEVARLREERDALKSFRASSVTQTHCDLAELDALDVAVGDEIDRAVEAARKAERPDPSHVLEDVYASY